MKKELCHHELTAAQDKLLLKYLKFGGVDNKNGWKEKDVRIAMFGRLSDELVVQFIHFRSLSIVGDDAWWGCQFPQNSDPARRKYFRDKYLDRIRHGHFVTFLGLLESKIRIIASHLNIPAAGLNYNKVYEAVLDKTGHPELKDFFKFVSCLRNLVHGNGYYTHPKEWEYTFRHIKYEFVPGKLVVGWFLPEVVHGIYEEILEALIKIVDSKIIKEKPFMEDDVARLFVANTPSSLSSLGIVGGTPPPPKTPQPPQSP